MVTIKATGEAVTETRAELAAKYFPGLQVVYAAGNMGIVSLLSDLQEFIGAFGGRSGEEYRRILNDIKCVLVTDNDKTEGK